MEFETPVLDNHLHLDPANGRGMEAVKDFARSGGTHLLVVNKPSWQLGVEADEPADFRQVFETTVGIVEQATELLEGRAWPVLGVHPGLITRLTDERDFNVEDARDLMQGGLEVAAEYLVDGPAVAIKSGRPHYDVSDAVWEASNDVMRHAFALAADRDGAVQLHTEGGVDFEAVGEWAEATGLPASRVVKHYAQGECRGVIGSVMSERERLQVAAEVGDPFLMETDFIDDSDRPGAVMGPKTVPRRTRWLQEEGYEEAIRRAHVETPRTVYGIDTVATMS